MLSVIVINASSEVYPHANMLHELIGSRDPPIKSVMFYEVWKDHRHRLLDLHPSCRPP